MATRPRRVVAAIDRFTDATGTAIAWLNVPLVVVVACEVVARYALDAPTIWSFDLTYMLYGAIFMLGAAYALRHGAHVRTDFFFERWSARTRGVIDAVAYIVFFFPALGVLLVIGWNEGWYAVTIGEVSEQTPWRPLMWPFKMIVPLSCLLLLLQGIAETIKSVYTAATGVELCTRERVEI